MTQLLTSRFFRSGTWFLGVLAAGVPRRWGTARAQQGLPDACDTRFSPTACSQPTIRACAGPSSTNPTRRIPPRTARPVDRLNIGPQIAVWVENADRSVFVDTLFVTNQVGARGIGNRPGLSNFVSSPKSPYGKRQMALPIWAHSRGKLYRTVVFRTSTPTGNPGACSGEGRIGFHEPCSSPEPYYCRPLMPTEFIDAITCPSALFNSSRGPLRRSNYPVRITRRAATLAAIRLNFNSRDYNVVNRRFPAAPSIRRGTPTTRRWATTWMRWRWRRRPTAQASSGTWTIQLTLAAGDYTYRFSGSN